MGRANGVMVIIANGGYCDAKPVRAVRAQSRIRRSSAGVRASTTKAASSARLQRRCRVEGTAQRAVHAARSSTPPESSPVGTKWPSSRPKPLKSGSRELAPKLLGTTLLQN